MKRFDFANDVAKQLITISSAIIAVVIAFYEKFLSHGTCTFVLVFLALFVFILSIISGVLTIGGLTNLVELQEYKDLKSESEENSDNASATSAGVPKPGTKEFVRLGGSAAQTCAIAQQALFALGLFLFIAAAIYDRATQ